MTWYNITVYLKEKEDSSNVQLLPEAELVIVIYEGRVYDLGDYTLDEIYQLAIDDIDEFDTEQIQTTTDIKKIERIDMANQ